MSCSLSASQRQDLLRAGFRSVKAEDGNREGERGSGEVGMVQSFVLFASRKKKSEAVKKKSLTLFFSAPIATAERRERESLSLSGGSNERAIFFACLEERPCSAPFSARYGKNERKRSVKVPFSFYCFFFQQSTFSLFPRNSTFSLPLSLSKTPHNNDNRPRASSKGSTSRPPGP